MPGLTPTQHTLRALRQQGRLCAIGEKWNPHVPRPDGGMGVRQDLFGFIDIICLDPERGFIGIQSTGQGFAEHVRNLLDGKATENVIEWLTTGIKSCNCPECGAAFKIDGPGKVEVWGWRKLLVKRGGKAKRWVPQVREITLADFTIKQKCWA